MGTAAPVDAGKGARAKGGLESRGDELGLTWSLTKLDFPFYDFF